MSKHIRLYVGLAAVFATCFLVLNWTYGYVVSFQSETNDCFFIFGRPFLLEFLDHPAGPLRYAARFLGQFYYHTWLGALIVSACITYFGFLFHRILAKLEGTVPLSQILLPCVLLLALHTSTIYVLHDTLGLCVSCGAFWGYLALPGKLPKRVYAVVATPIIYLLVGVHVWFLVVWIIGFESLGRPLRSAFFFNVLYVVSSVAVPMIAWRWMFPITLRSAFTYPIDFCPPVRTGWSEQTSAQFAVDCVLAVALCGLLFVLPFWGRLFSGPRLATFWQIKAGRRNYVALTIAFCVIAFLLHLNRYDARLATIVACRQLYKARQWDALLEKAKDNPFGDLRVQFMTNFALYHKGKLLDEMFSYPQPRGTRGVFLNFTGTEAASPGEDDTDDGMYNSDLLYEMGHANYSRWHAYNCISMYGKTYEAVQRMAQCSMLNGNYSMARKYLNLLEKTIFYRDLARRYKAIIADPDAAEREFGDLRKCLPTVRGSGHPVKYFTTLLESKPDNRMARDYLVAWLLLDKRQDSLAAIYADIGQLRVVGYDSIPTHCQEAMLLVENAERTLRDTRESRYDRAIVARVDRFLQAISGNGVSQDMERIRALYGDMYLFYCFCVTTPGDVPRAAGPDGGFGGGSREE